MAEQPALPAWHAERYRRMADRKPGLVTVIEATTPDTRDRAVDALRALAILGVILGHWLVTAVVNTGGVLHAASPLTTMPALAPISWLLQTLAIFFLVGGYTTTRSYLTTHSSTPTRPTSTRGGTTRTRSTQTTNPREGHPPTRAASAGNQRARTNQLWPERPDNGQGHSHRTWLRRPDDKQDRSHQAQLRRSSNGRGRSYRTWLGRTDDRQGPGHQAQLRQLGNGHGRRCRPWLGRSGDKQDRGYRARLGRVGDSRDRSYRAWLERRAVRLVKPVPILLAVWAGAVPLLLVAGYPAGTIGSLINLVLDPLWFLLVYLGLTALTPIVAGAVRRWGAWAAALPVAATALIDLSRFALGGPPWLSWLTVASAWLVPFTLGAAWAHGSFTPHNPSSPAEPSRSNGPRRLRDPRHAGPGRDGPARGLARDGARTWLGPLALLVGGGAAAIGLVVFGGYPASMVGVPGQPVSNLSPPTLAAVAFGLAQCGAALLLRGPLARLMRRPVLWAGVAMVNLSAMTLFLWHQTAMLGVSALVTRITDTVPGLLDPPGHPGWIFHRLVWIPVFAAVLAGLWSLAHRFERRIRFQPTGRPVHLTKRPNASDWAFGTRTTTTGCAEHRPG
ncbi:acyltransferase family protein [Actinomadura rupiterrae]|uniref:acyltransferase family protein n=1 Tax=Actinomadura rupiterrae TaxID=559627 RepID=UPI0020A56881|nr:acyltransferase family protein [Actinomadura rupiterrae]MCP2335726.1 hypothetical protein [Actinomadura rupiterrae]